MPSRRPWPPSLALLLLEAPRAFLESSLLLPALPLLRAAPRGDGHAVLVLPGFVATDLSTRVLREYLTRLGYRAHGWGFGRNLGLEGDLGRRLLRRLEDLHRRDGKCVSLVGWSLGGIYARELAKRAPETVRQVITLGSPFGGDRNGGPDPTWLERAVSGEELPPRARERPNRLHPPPVPCTAIFSRSDGIAPWQACVEGPGEQTDNIEVVGSHCGLGFHPAVLYAVADRLAQPAGAWKPFDRSGLRRAFFA
jgi:pimeloyl-ACP methyl ester carboxylesterase